MIDTEMQTVISKIMPCGVKHMPSLTTVIRVDDCCHYYKYLSLRCFLRRFFKTHTHLVHTYSVHGAQISRHTEIQAVRLPPAQINQHHNSDATGPHPNNKI